MIKGRVGFVGLFLFVLVSLIPISTRADIQFIPFQPGQALNILSCPSSGANAPARISTAICERVDACIPDSSYNGFACALLTAANSEIGGALGLNLGGHTYRESVTGISRDIRLGRVTVNDANVCRCLTAIQNAECSQVTAQTSPGNRYARPQNLLTGLEACRQVFTLARPFRSIAAGAEQYYILKYDGTLLAWGQNENGEMGDGTTTPRALPAPVPITNVSNIFVPLYHNGGNRVYAQKTDGTLWGWGDNQDGAFGPGGTDQLIPELIPGISQIKDLVESQTHTLALKNDGTVWAWGENRFGELGDGTTVTRATPRQVPGLTDVVAIAANYRGSFAVKRDGTVWRWGAMLNDSEQIPQPTPAQVPDLRDVNIKSIWVDPGNLGLNYALNSEGTAILWDIHDPDGPESPFKVLVSPGEPFTGNKKLYGIAGGPLALNEDGKVYAVAYRYGEVAVYVYWPELTNVLDIHGGGGRENFHNIILKKDGSLWRKDSVADIPVEVRIP